MSIFNTIRSWIMSLFGKQAADKFSMMSMIYSIAWQSSTQNDAKTAALHARSNST